MVDRLKSTKRTFEGTPNGDVVGGSCGQGKPSGVFYFEREVI